MPEMRAGSGPARNTASESDPAYVWLGDRIAMLPLPCGYEPGSVGGSSARTSS